jgi:hypothetical protein
MTNEELPELPQWVKDLVEAAESRGYSEGYEAGQMQMWYLVSGVLERSRPYGA